MKMASNRKSSKSGRSSINYHWIPLEVQSYEPDNVSPKENFKANYGSFTSSSTKTDNRSSCNGISTAKLVSAVGNIWEFVAQPEALLKKENCNHGFYYFEKDNVFEHSESESLRQGKPCGDNDYSGSAKLEFKNLNSIKRTLLFSSSNVSRSIISKQRQVANFPSDESDTKICKFNGLDIPSDLSTFYGCSVLKHFIVPEHFSTVKSSEFNNSFVSCSSGEITLTCGGSRTSNEIENPSCEAKHISENLQDSQPSASSDERMDVSACMDIQLDSKSEVITSKNVEQSTNSCCTIGNTSTELFALQYPGVHEHSGNILQEIVIKELTEKRWPSLPDKLHHTLIQSRHAIAGAMAGTLVSLCLHPLDTIKTMVQSNKMGQMSYYQVVRAILLKRGILGLYRGISSNIVASAPISALYTFTYESVKGGLLPLLSQELYSFAHCVAGGCSSIATSFIFTPSERIKQQMQVGLQYQNCWNALIGILHKGGVASLYAGWGAVLCRNVPHSIIKFYTYERLKRVLLTSSEREAPVNIFKTLLCGGLAGSTAALFTTPFDVIKTRLQTQEPGSLGKYNGVVHALKDIAKSEGLHGLYRGLVPRLAMYVSQGAIFFASYEFMKVILSLDIPTKPPVSEHKVTDEASGLNHIQKVLA